MENEFCISNIRFLKIIKKSCYFREKDKGLDDKVLQAFCKSHSINEHLFDISFVLNTIVTASCIVSLILVF